MLLLGYPKVFHYTTFEHWHHSFLSYALTISVKNALTDPMTLTFQPQIPVTSRSFPIPSLKTLGAFVFSYAADKQTDGLEKILPMPADKSQHG